MTFKQTLVQLGDRLREVREDKCLSQQTLAQAINKETGYIQRLESGLIDPNVVDLLRLINELRLPVSQFFEDFPG